MMSPPNFNNRRLFMTAAIKRPRTSGMEAATLRQVSRTWHLPTQHFNSTPLSDISNPRRGIPQGNGIRVLGVQGNVVSAADLNYPAEIHHRDSVGNQPSKRQVVSDEE